MKISKYIRKRMRLVNTVILSHLPLTVKCNICFHTWNPEREFGKDPKRLWYLCPKGCGRAIIDQELAKIKKNTNSFILSLNVQISSENM